MTDLVALDGATIAFDLDGTLVESAPDLIGAVETVGGDLARTVMIGDSDTDAGAARAAGTPLILVDFGYSEIPAGELAPDVLLHNFDDLVGACASLLNGPRSVSPLCETAI